MPKRICKCVLFDELPSLESDKLSESLNELLKKEYLKRIYDTIGDTVVVDARNIEWSFNLPAEGESKDYKYKLRKADHLRNLYITKKQTIPTAYPLKSDDLNELDGIVISEELAKISPCIKIKDTNLVFTKGVVGALNREQKEKFCPTITEVERPEFKKRTARWSMAVKTCKERTKHLSGADRVKAYIECMSEEARLEKLYKQRVSYI